MASWLASLHVCSVGADCPPALSGRQQGSSSQASRPPAHYTSYNTAVRFMSPPRGFGTSLYHKLDSDYSNERKGELNAISRQKYNVGGSIMSLSQVKNGLHGISLRHGTGNVRKMETGMVLNYFCFPVYSFRGGLHWELWHEAAFWRTKPHLNVYNM